MMICMQKQGKLARWCGGGGRALQRSGAVLGILFDAAEFPFTILRRSALLTQRLLVPDHVSRDIIKYNLTNAQCGFC